MGIRRLRLQEEPVARRLGRADPAFAGRRDFCQRQIRRISTAQSVAELILVIAMTAEKKRPVWAPFRSESGAVLLRGRGWSGGRPPPLRGPRVLARRLGASLAPFR